MADKNQNLKSIPAPDLPNVIEDAKRDTALSINCTQIGVIQSFDPATQRASIQIAMKQVKDIAEDGTRTIQEYPLLLECPVMVLFGGVDILTMPIIPGDNCIVLFNDRQIDEWMYNGNGQTPTIPRVHDLSDGIAIVGIRPLTNSITNYLANGIRLSHGVGNSQIDLKDNLIDSIAELFFHHGDLRVSQDATIDRDLEVKRDFYIRGDTYGDSGGDWRLRANLDQEPGYEIHDGRRVSGTFDVVTVVDGIVVGGS